MADTSPLTDEERAELEELRAQKAAREEAAQREELERLRSERAAAEANAAEDARIAEVRERNRKLMEPDDDLKMPLGQKVVLIAVAIIALAIVASIALG